MTYLLIVSLLMTAAHAVKADETAPPPSIAAYGDQNPDCLEWTDSCIVCRRVSDTEFSCSTPGIACQPGGVTCNERTR